MYEFQVLNKACHDFYYERDLAKLFNRFNNQYVNIIHRIYQYRLVKPVLETLCILNNKYFTLYSIVLVKRFHTNPRK